MTALRKEVLGYIETISDKRLKILKPILEEWADSDFVIETDLTEEEKAIIREGREQYKDGDFVTLDQINWK